MAEPRLNSQGGSVVLYDAQRLPEVPVGWFQESYWRAANKVVGQASGRGSVVFIEHADETWVLRHYHRGGFIGRFVHDRYLWRGAAKTRAFREWHLLSTLREKDLPVPTPIAARIRRRGLGYTADIITVYLENTRSLESLLDEGRVPGEIWEVIGRTLRRFHEHGVSHIDLNVRNILIDEEQRAYLIDFDKGEIKDPGSWRDVNLRRLQRSLHKTSLETGVEFDSDGWKALERAYRLAA